MLKKVILILIALNILTTNSPLVFAAIRTSNAQVPEDAFEYNGHHYKIYVGVCNTWEESKEYCEKLGGHLAVISSQEENDALYKYLIDSNIKTAYFGFSDSENEGTWKWVTEEENTYTNWHSGEPNSESGEDYAELYWKFPDGTWNDGNFGSGTQSDSKNFICEWENETQSSPTYSEMHGWCLSNNKESYGYDSNYRIPISQYYSTYGISLATLIESSVSSIPKWGGNCFGLSLLSLAQYYNLIDISPYFNKSGDTLYSFGYDSIYKDSAGKECFSIANNKEAISIIERALISQDSVEFSECEILKGDANFNKLIEFLSSEDAKPIMVSFRSGMSGHAMILTTDIKPTRLTGEDADWYCVSAYDPNAPANSNLLESPMSYYERGDSYLLVNPSTTEWKYYVNGSVHMSNKYHSFDSFSMLGNITGQSIWYYDVSLLDSSFFTKTLNLWHYRIQLQIFGDSAVVRDENGKVLLELKDNEVKNISNECNIKTHFNAGGEVESYVVYTDISNLEISSDSATILTSSNEYIVSAKLNHSYNVNINFNAKQVFVYGIETNNKFEICIQDSKTQAVKLIGDNIEGNNVSLSFIDGIVTVDSKKNDVNLTYECENLSKENIRLSTTAGGKPINETFSAEDVLHTNTIELTTVYISIFATVLFGIIIFVIIMIRTRRKGVKKPNTNSEDIRCTKCGEINTFGAKFCSKCGHKMNDNI